MSDIAIKFENISKQYRLGIIGTGTLSHDLKRWWTMNVCGKEDPYLKVDDTNSRSIKAESKYIWALRDINLEVRKGEVLGIIGKNGAGKSTMLKLLSRVTTPTTGTIRARGRIASLLEVGTGFHPELTGRENIYMNGSIMGMTKAEIVRKFDEIVYFAGVSKYIDTPVKRYSSGMTVRLGFAIAAHLEPEILVVDEVLAVGDAEFQKKAVGKMQDVSREEGRTVLFVSHNMTAVSNLCNNLCVLQDGLIDYLGNVYNGVEHYLRTSTIGASKYPGMLKEKIITIDDPDFKLIEVQIEQNRKTDRVFYTDIPIKLMFEYEVKKRLHGLRIGFDLEDNNNGLTLFRTYHDDAMNSTVHEPGVFSLTALIPANLLKPGFYLIKLAISIHNVRWITHEQIVIPINLYNISGLNKQYADTRPGIIMPLIDWNFG